MSSKGNIERNSRKGVRIGNALKQLDFGDWLVLSLLGSNVQVSMSSYLFYSSLGSTIFESNVV